MSRREERIFRINDEIAALHRDEYLAFEELIMLGHINDDAQRDSATSGNPRDAVEARETEGDVVRMKRHVADLRTARERLEQKRDQLLQQLGMSVVD